MNAYPYSNLYPDSATASRITAVGVAVLTVLVMVAIPTVLQAQSCSGLTPAFAVPENLWIDGIFRPGDTSLPGNQIPAERDSTSWEALTIPGCTSGHEIFESLDIAGDYLYVAYNAGFSVWDIGDAGAEDPQRLAVRDGFSCAGDPCQVPCGPFLSFPSAGGSDFLVDDIAVLDEGTIHTIAVSGITPVGMSLWQFNTDTEALTPIYQETIRSSRQVRLAAVDDVRGVTTVYAFSSYNGGLAVYDVTQALAIAPCLEETGSDCPGVFLGTVGTSSDGRYLDLLQRPGGEILIANTNGNAAGLGLELWELPDPGTPSTAEQLFSGLDNMTFGTALFNYEGNDYLAALERDGSFNVIKIFNVNACGGGPCTLGPPVFDDVRVPPRTTDQFLTFSTSNTTPFLYHGLVGSLGGPKVEQLLDLTTLGRPDQNIVEMTSGGPTYFDACELDDLDYWPWYYPANEFGLKNLAPRVGKFDADSNFFYRAAGGVLDVHLMTRVACIEDSGTGACSCTSDCATCSFMTGGTGTCSTEPGDVAACCGDFPFRVFADGFESGDTSAWTSP